MEKGPERPKMFGKIPEAQIRDLEDDIEALREEIEGIRAFTDEKTRKQDEARVEQLRGAIRTKENEIERIRRGAPKQGI